MGCLKNVSKFGPAVIFGPADIFKLTIYELYYIKDLTLPWESSFTWKLNLR